MCMVRWTVCIQCMWYNIGPSRDCIFTFHHVDRLNVYGLEWHLTIMNFFIDVILFVIKNYFCCCFCHLISNVGYHCNLLGQSSCSSKEFSWWTTRQGFGFLRMYFLIFELIRSRTISKRFRGINIKFYWILNNFNYVYICSK